jgi:alkylmercury lyase
METTTYRETKASLTAADLEQLAQVFIKAFPVMKAEEQGLALKLYLLLSEGKPVPLALLASELGRPISNIEQTLAAWPGVFYDDAGGVVGFWGIAVGKMTHRLDLDGRTAYAWCAWDTLFIPELLNATARVTSRCAATGEAITLTMSPSRIGVAVPADVVVSFLIPDQAALKRNVTASFCHYVHFFRDREAGARWTAQHPGTFLLSLEEAFAVGKRMNAVRYREVFEDL